MPATSLPYSLATVHSVMTEAGITPLLLFFDDSSHGGAQRLGSGEAYGWAKEGSKTRVGFAHKGLGFFFFSFKEHQI